MKSEVFQIESKEQMRRFGERLAALLERGDVVGLCGDLGAGKTFLAGVVARAVGVPGHVPVNSPTFTLINEYHGGRFTLFHMDLYRLRNPSELYDLGLWEYYDGDGVCLVEWCDRFLDLWPDRALVLTIGLREGEKRTILATGEGRGARLVEQLGK